MQVQLEDKKILIEALYGPNQDTPEFYTDQVFKKLQEWDPDYAIFAGDYNVALDQEKDTKNYLHINNPNAANALRDQMDQFNLVDVWREQHPDERTFTWRKFNGKKQGRLDYFLISASLMPFVQKASITPRGIYSCMISYCLPLAFEENLLFPS